MAFGIALFKKHLADKLSKDAAIDQAVEKFVREGLKANGFPAPNDKQIDEIKQAL